MAAHGRGCRYLQRRLLAASHAVISVHLERQREMQNLPSLLPRRRCSDFQHDGWTVTSYFDMAGNTAQPPAMKAHAVNEFWSERGSLRLDITGRPFATSLVVDPAELAAFTPRIHRRSSCEGRFTRGGETAGRERPGVHGVRTLPERHTSAIVPERGQGAHRDHPDELARRDPPRKPARDASRSTGRPPAPWTGDSIVGRRSARFVERGRARNRFDEFHGPGRSFRREPPPDRALFTDRWRHAVVCVHGRRSDGLHAAVDGGDAAEAEHCLLFEDACHEGNYSLPTMLRPSTATHRTSNPIVRPTDRLPRRLV